MKFPNPFRFAAEIFRAVRAELRGENAIVSQEEFEDRIKTCERCPHFDWEIRQCRVCTCFVDLKANLRTSECPKHLWLKPQLTTGMVQRFFTTICRFLLRRK